MCTDLRLVRLKDLHVSGRTMDFGDELRVRVQVVPAGLDWSATETGTKADPLRWTNPHGYVAMDVFGLDWVACDGLNDAGLSIGALWLPETDLPQAPPAAGVTPAIDLHALDLVHVPPAGGSDRRLHAVVCRLISRRRMADRSPGPGRLLLARCRRIPGWRAHPRR